MKTQQISQSEANDLPEGTLIKWLKDNKYYRMSCDGDYVQTAPPTSFCDCPCHGEGAAMMHAIPCCQSDPDTLYMVGK